jgi:hypothetical protein
MKTDFFSPGQEVEADLRSNLYGERTPEGSLAAQALQLPSPDSEAMRTQLQNRWEPGQ